MPGPIWALNNSLWPNHVFLSPRPFFFFLFAPEEQENHWQWSGRREKIASRFDKIVPNEESQNTEISKRKKHINFLIDGAGFSVTKLTLCQNIWILFSYLYDYAKCGWLIWGDVKPSLFKWHMFEHFVHQKCFPALIACLISSKASRVFMLWLLIFKAKDAIRLISIYTPTEMPLFSHSEVQNKQFPFRYSFQMDDCCQPPLFIWKCWVLTYDF